MAIGAVADERVDEPGTLRRLGCVSAEFSEA